MIPMLHQTLKFAHVSSEKLNATYRLRQPIAAKKPIHAHVSRVHTASGNWNSSVGMTLRSQLVPYATRPTSSVAAHAQYRTVGFQRMNRSSCSSSVAPPNTTMMPSDSHCIVEIGRPRNLNH